MGGHGAALEWLCSQPWLVHTCVGVLGANLLPGQAKSGGVAVEQEQTACGAQADMREAGSVPSGQVADGCVCELVDM